MTFAAYESKRQELYWIKEQAHKTYIECKTKENYQQWEDAINAYGRFLSRKPSANYESKRQELYWIKEKAKQAYIGHKTNENFRRWEDAINAYGDFLATAKPIY